MGLVPYPKPFLSNKLVPSCVLSVYCNIAPSEGWISPMSLTVIKKTKKTMQQQTWLITCQDEDISQAFLMELLHHLRQVSKVHWVKGEDSPLVSVIQVIPLHILYRSEHRRSWSVGEPLL